MDYWTPEPIFSGETVFCLASGPSLTPEIADRFKGRRAIAVNSASLLMPTADALFFTDGLWFDRHREFAEAWAGLVVTLSPHAKRSLPDRVNLIRGDGEVSPPIPPFPPAGHPVVRQGRSSGHTAVGLAIAMGAARIVLCGYDMQPRNEEEAVIFPWFVAGFEGWNDAALAHGVEILNATPDGAVTEFPMVHLEDALAWA